jgi:hypothetical protein
MVADTNTIEAIEKIISFIVIIAGIVGGMITTISVAKKSLLETSTKASVDRSTVKIAKEKSDMEIAIAKEKSDIEIDAAKIEMAQQLQHLYTQLTLDMELKFKAAKAEMDEKSQQHGVEIAEIKCLLDKVTGERDNYKKAAIKLIHAIEEGVTLRAKISADLNNCSACVVSDQKLLETLKDVKTLFENGVK